MRRERDEPGGDGPDHERAGREQHEVAPQRRSVGHAASLLSHHVRAVVLSKTPLPSPLTLMAGVVAAFFGLLVSVRGPVDADYWWHLTTGRLILQTGSVPSTDPYSFAYDGPWVAHEWLGEVVIAALVDSIGYPLTGLVFGLLVAAALMIPAWSLARGGIAGRAILPWVAVGSYTLASYATVRPQVASWLLLSVLIVLLMRLRTDNRRLLWFIPALFLLWANLHGLWVVGIAVLAVYVAFTVVGRTPMAGSSAMVLGVMGLSIGATALTPSFVDGMLYPLRYLRQDDWGTAFIAEWQPADFTDPRSAGLAVLILGTLLLGRRGVPGWLVVVAVAGLLSPLIAVRNAPLAVILSMPTLAMGLQAWLGPGGTRSPVAARRRRLVELAAASAIVVGMVVVLPPAVSGDARSAFPTAAFDVLEERDPDARALVDYDWGGYAIARLHANGGQVFIDGRSDMYPREIFEDYLEIRAGTDRWQALAERYEIDAILLPPTAELVAAERPGWCSAHADEQAVLLLPCP